MLRQLLRWLAPWYAVPEDPDDDPKTPVDPKAEGTREGEVDLTQKESKDYVK